MRSRVVDPLGAYGILRGLRVIAAVGGVWESCEPAHDVPA